MVKIYSPALEKIFVVGPSTSLSLPLDIRICMQCDYLRLDPKCINLITKLSLILVGFRAVITGTVQ